jgi:hypothetical protein
VRGLHGMPALQAVARDQAERPGPQIAYELMSADAPATS